MQPPHPHPQGAQAMVPSDAASEKTAQSSLLVLPLGGSQEDTRQYLAEGSTLCVDILEMMVSPCSTSLKVR